MRFSSVTEEIEPLQRMITSEEQPDETEPLRRENQADLDSLAMSLKSSQLQGCRLRNYSFDTVSLPSSRVCRIVRLQILARF